MNTTDHQYYSNGKLLLTGEYLVIYGAKALALPLKFGQSLKVGLGEKGFLQWEAYIQGKAWFHVTFNLKDMQESHYSDINKVSYLKLAIQAAKKLNPEFLTHSRGYKVITDLNYPQQWGLGSSSSFISNLAYWAEVDPMLLHQAVSNGSGYDIACARSNSPLIYKIEGKPVWEELDFSPPFSENLFFLYLGKKQNTTGSVENFRKLYKYSKDDVEYISKLTQQFILTENLDDAVKIIEEHEEFMGRLLNLLPVKQNLFSDFTGSIKSLGAWGGDFVLVATHLHFEEVKSYFQTKGFVTLFKYEELVLSKPAG